MYVPNFNYSNPNNKIQSRHTTPKYNSTQLYVRTQTRDNQCKDHNKLSPADIDPLFFSDAITVMQPIPWHRLDRELMMSFIGDTIFLFLCLYSASYWMKTYIQATTTVLHTLRFLYTSKNIHSLWTCNGIWIQLVMQEFGKVSWYECEFGAIAAGRGSQQNLCLHDLGSH